jgi:hypothetical protein
MIPSTDWTAAQITKAGKIGSLFRRRYASFCASDSLEDVLVLRSYLLRKSSYGSTRLFLLLPLEHFLKSATRKSQW